MGNKGLLTLVHNEQGGYWWIQVVFPNVMCDGNTYDNEENKCVLLNRI